MNTRTASTGAPLERVDAPLKVTGLAPYAYEQALDQVYLWPIVSTIARGSISTLDVSAAAALPGVLLVLTHENAPRLLIKADPALFILQSPKIHYKGQFIGAVVAESPTIARHAAELVVVTYQEEKQESDFRPDHPARYAPKKVNGMKKADVKRGDVDHALARAAQVIDEVYTHPVHHHSPLEPHAVVARWNPVSAFNLTAKRLTLWDANQGVIFHQALLTAVLGVLPNQLEIISPYVGGSFGTKGMPHSHLVLTALAAKLLPGRAVSYAMTRQQMFVNTGYRPESHQRVRLGADAGGKLLAITHEATSSVAKLKEYVDQSATPTRVMYASEAIHTQHFAVPLDLAPGMFMRAPGEFTGMFALEVAMDELAEKCGLDPIEFRIRNEPAVDPENGKPFSTRNLVTCLREGATLFGWETRDPRPACRRTGEWLIGMGVAAATYPNQHIMSTRARVRFAGGRYKVELGASDIGTGARTSLPQIAADALQIDVGQIDLEIGRTGLPMAILAGGSMGTYTWGSSIIAAAKTFRKKFGPTPDEGARATAFGKLPKDFKEFSRHAFGAHFAEVKVSEVTGEVRVSRMLGYYAAGRIINPRLARSQFIGGMTMGISAALHEESVRDPRFGHVVNADLAGYHIASHADVAEIRAEWVDEFDPYFGPTGAKGIGELGIVGVPAAISNAVYHATGKRLRSMPFTPDKLL